MKLTKEELKNKISELNIDAELQIALLEDIEDSMGVPAEDKSEEIKAEADKAYKELNDKYTSLLTRYKDRFLDKVTEDELDKDSEPEVEEKQVIDVKELF